MTTPASAANETGAEQAAERLSALRAIPATEHASVGVLDSWLTALHLSIAQSGGRPRPPRGWELAIVLAWCAGAGVSIVAASDRRAVLVRGLGGRYASPRVVAIAKAKLAAACGAAALPVGVAAEIVDDSLRHAGLAMRTASIPRGKARTAATDTDTESEK